MIRVNLLPGAGQRSAKGLSQFFPMLAEQRAALFGVTVLMATAVLVAGWWWTLDQERRQIDAVIGAQEATLVQLQEAARLVEAADVRAADLRERVGLIARLRATQRAPVQLLETISDSLPDGLWLLELKQQGASVRMEGRALSLTALTDFVDRLQTSGHFLHTLDIVTTSMEMLAEQSVVRFAVRGDVRSGQVQDGQAQQGRQ
jgi:type IV pilus assembly protein PilN